MLPALPSSGCTNGKLMSLVQITVGFVLVLTPRVQLLSGSVCVGSVGLLWNSAASALPAGAGVKSPIEPTRSARTLLAPTSKLSEIPRREPATPGWKEKMLDLKPDWMDQSPLKAHPPKALCTNPVEWRAN